MVQKKGTFPFQINEISSEEMIIYTPSVWSFKVNKSNENQQFQIDLSHLLHSYVKLECIQDIFITTKQYKALLNILDTFPDGIEKRKLKYFIKLYRNRAPKIVEKVLINKK